MVIEIRAHLGGMTLHQHRRLSRDEARRLSPQEVDPIDEEAQTPAPATPRPSRRRSRAVRVIPGRYHAVRQRIGSRVRCGLGRGDDAVLFGALWPWVRP